MAVVVGVEVPVLRPLLAPLMHAVNLDRVQLVPQDAAAKELEVSDVGCDLLPFVLVVVAAATQQLANIVTKVG
jgi:hypothetical protein